MHFSSDGFEAPEFSFCGFFLNAPFINTIKENGLEAVIRLKDEKRLIFQDAGGFFNRGEGEKEIVSTWKKDGRGMGYFRV